MHLSYEFASQDALLKMQRIKIVQSANASYFEVNSFTDGYAGLQQTADASYGNPNILLSSMWDANTANQNYAVVEYTAPTTSSSRFGGEGDGWKTVNPYGWQLNTWYNLVNRAWRKAGRLHIATFINDGATGRWLHSATLSTPFPNKYLTAYNDAFLENWNGFDPSENGRFVRKAFFKDCWILNTSGTWEKSLRIYCSVNGDADRVRNGIYHDRFNAFYDGTENAYCMQHGGSTTPSADFQGGRTVYFPPQANQGNAPVLGPAVVTSVAATYATGTLTVNWAMDERAAPQLAAKVEIIDAAATVIRMVEDTLPQRRSASISYSLPPGTYTARVQVRDIFNVLSAPATSSFSVSGGPSSGCNRTLNQPGAMPDRLAVSAGSLTIGPAQLLANDTDPLGRSLRVASVGQPVSGTLTSNANGSFTYTPWPGFVGTDSFQYLIEETGPVLASAATGHYYEFVCAPGICWAAASGRCSRAVCRRARYTK